MTRRRLEEQQHVGGSTVLQLSLPGRALLFVARGAVRIQWRQRQGRRCTIEYINGKVHNRVYAIAWGIQLRALLCAVYLQPRLA